MSERTIERLEPRIGETTDLVRGLTIEPGKVAEFAAAVGHDEPLFRDAEAAARQGFERIPAPPTFTRKAMFPRYRPPAVGRIGFDVGFDRLYELHGEQHYEFERPVYVGDTLDGETTLADAYEREGGQDSTMTFAVLETKYADGTEKPVVVERQTFIEYDGPVPGERPVEGLRGGGPDRRDIRLADGTFETPSSATDVSVSDGGPTLIAEDVTPRDFVQHAGASRDFNPIHYDEHYARGLGKDGVFGQGMLTAGYAGRFVTDWLGLAAIRRFRTRFTARVWPGDTITVSGMVTDVDPPDVVAEFSATRQTGETVLLDYATAALDRIDHA